MARALVVYESMFGNTRDVAIAIAEGMSELEVVDIAEVGAMPGGIPSDVDLLVVGAPTHAFGLSRPSTRKSALDQSADEIVSEDVGLREFLAALPHREHAVAAAAFDTRIKVALMPGSAARAATRRLRGLGFTICAEPESFYVKGTSGPLLDDERARATRWGQHVASAHIARQTAR